MMTSVAGRMYAHWVVVTHRTGPQFFRNTYLNFKHRSCARPRAPTPASTPRVSQPRRAQTLTAWQCPVSCRSRASRVIYTQFFVLYISFSVRFISQAVGGAADVPALRVCGTTSIVSCSPAACCPWPTCKVQYGFTAIRASVVSLLANTKWAAWLLCWGGLCGENQL